MQLTNKILNHISQAHGDSFYILDSKEFSESYKELTSAFQAYYPKACIAYSYKTNYIPRLCSIVSELGGYAEVVSDMELQVASAIGVRPNKVFYNGPYKSARAINELLVSGGMVNADSEADLDVFKFVAKNNPDKELHVGVRCNFNIGDDVVSRFGFDVSNGDLHSVIELIESYPNLVLTGLHCHFASRGLKSWCNASAGMLDIVKNYQERYSKSIEFVSLGGGLYGHMSKALEKQLGITCPSFDEYAEIAAKPFAEFFRNVGEDRTPVLIIEPGTALAANALKFIAKVVNIKKVGKKSIATLSGSSFNTNPTSNKINLPITVFSSDEDEIGNNHIDLDMAGYTCIETDYLYRNYNGPLSVGDFVVFDAAGSYSVVMKPPFILPNVPVLEFDEDLSIRVIKRQETFEDVFQTYRMDF